MDDRGSVQQCGFTCAVARMAIWTPPPTFAQPGTSQDDLRTNVVQYDVGQANELKWAISSKIGKCYGPRISDDFGVFFVFESII